MTDYRAPTTELEAVNLILNVMGDSPVSSIDVDNPEAADAAIALQVLREMSRRVQSKGWHWNTETDYTVTPDGDGFITLPTNCLRVDNVDYVSTGGIQADIIQRGTRLYDKSTQSYVFAASFAVEMVIVLEFEELPEAARDYIAIRAARVHQTRQLGSVTLANFSKDEENDARLVLEQADGDTGDFNQLRNNPANARLYRNRPSF